MLALFGLELIAGISLMWCLLPRKQVTAGFFRIQMLLVLGLSAVVFLAAGMTQPSAPPWQSSLVRMAAGLTGAAAYAGSIVWMLDRRAPGNVLVYVVCGLSAAALAPLAWFAGEPAWLSMLSSFATAGSLGGAVTGMLLGHWYLTAPTMSIAPLERLTWCYLAAVVVRLVVSAVGYAFATDLLHGSLPWTWLALRWLAGILGPLVLCGMTLRILRYKNTQAATGVLFASVILAFIGELSATLLLSETQRPW